MRTCGIEHEVTLKTFNAKPLRYWVELEAENDRLREECMRLLTRNIAGLSTFLGKSISYWLQLEEEKKRKEFS